MTIRLKAAVMQDGEVRLMLPDGRHLERDGWYVAADLHAGVERLLSVRVWTPADEGFRVIVLDASGAEHESLRAPTLRAAESVMSILNGSQRAFPNVDGRRLVSGGDRDWEIAAELRRVGDDELLFVRIWLQTKQAFTVYAIDEKRVVRGHAAAATYGKAADEIVNQLLR